MQRRSARHLGPPIIIILVVIGLFFIVARFDYIAENPWVLIVLMAIAALVITMYLVERKQEEELEREQYLKQEQLKQEILLELEKKRMKREEKPAR